MADIWDFVEIGCILSYNLINTFKWDCVIINTFFSPFTILIIKSEKQTDYFNDDAGLSTLGFICKNLPKKIDKPFCLSEELDIILFTKKLKGKFIYDNNGIAYELLKI